MSDLPANVPTGHSRTKLIRAVGLLGLTAISLNGVIGSGIFVLPATVSALLGPASPIAYLIAALVNALIVLCFAEAGSMFDRTGGPYVYAREAFGSFVGFEVGWLFLLTRLAASAAITKAFTNYLGYFWPSLSQGPGRIIAATVSIVALTWINLIGVRYASWTVNLLTVGKLIPLLLFISIGLFWINPEALKLHGMPASLNLRQASLALIFAYGGFENASVPTEEVKNPKRSLPTALIISMSTTTVVYVLIQIVTQGTLPGLATSQTPLASSAATFLGSAGGVLLTAAAILSTFGSNSALTLVVPRILYALAEGGQLPKALARVHPRYRTPHVSTIAFALVAWVIALYGNFDQLAAVSAMSRLSFSAATCLAVPVLRRRKPERERHFKLKGGPTIPLVAALTSLWLLTGITREQAIAGAVALAVGASLYLYSTFVSGRSSSDATDS
jgi:basic amino acid/polyamine antiporter, APA family